MRTIKAVGPRAALLAMLLLGTLAAFALLAVLPPGGVAHAEEDRLLMKRLRELTGRDGSVDAPYGSGQPEELAVEEAVERFWDISTEALTTADATRLPEIMGGMTLERTQARYRELQEAGQVVDSEIQAIAPIAFVELVPEWAIVYVEVRSRGSYREVATGREVSSWPSQIFRQYYLLEPSDGVWKVTDTTTQSD
jgi:hypothetical protein